MASPCRDVSLPKEQAQTKKKASQRPFFDFFLSSQWVFVCVYLFVTHFRWPTTTKSPINVKLWNERNWKTTVADEAFRWIIGTRNDWMEQRRLSSSHEWTGKGQKMKCVIYRTRLIEMRDKHSHKQTHLLELIKLADWIKQSPWSVHIFVSNSAIQFIGTQFVIENCRPACIQPHIHAKSITVCARSAQIYDNHMAKLYCVRLTLTTIA